MLAKLVAALVTLLLASACAAAIAKAPQADASITMGSVAMDIPVEMVKRMSSLTNYLALNTGINVRFKASPNLGSAVDDLGSNQTQIAYLTPVAYIEAQKKYGVIPLVAPTISGRPHLSLVIGVKSGSSIRTPADLKGRRVRVNANSNESMDERLDRVAGSSSIACFKAADACDGNPLRLEKFSPAPAIPFRQKVSRENKCSWACCSWRIHSARQRRDARLDYRAASCGPFATAQ